MSPTAPGTPCPSPGCPEITPPGTHCEGHRSERWDDDRPSASDRGYDSRWRRIRASHVRREPLCRECRSRGRTTAVEEVDHVVPHRMVGVLLRAHWNLQSLCKSCHGDKTGREDADWTELRWPLMGEPRRPVVVVVGPPGAGKTTFIERHRQDSDDVADLQAIRDKHPTSSVKHLLHLRNQRIGDMARRDTDDTLWVELMAKRSAYRAFWRWNLSAELELVVPTRGTCQQRIRQRGRDVDELVERCTEWFRYYDVESDEMHAETP